MLKIPTNNQHANDHFSLVILEMKNKIDRFSRSLHFKLGKTSVKIKPANKPLLTFLSQEKNLKDIILCQPDQFRIKIEDWKLNNPSWFINTTVEFNILKSVFLNTGYNKSLNKLNFIQNIGLSSCPYCNRSYTYSLDNAGKVKPEIDHFYPSSLYPILAVSYYNLIPSCEVCNGTNCKHNEDSYALNLVNPYLISNSDFKFKYKLNKLSRVNPISGILDIDITFENSSHPNIDVFKLDKLYSMHKDHVVELIMKSKFKYNEKYRAYLKSYQYLKLNDAEIDRLIVGNYTRENEFHKRPLAKLYTDVSKHLGLIK